MAFVLHRERVAALCSFVDQRVRQDGCDHSHRFAREWAMGESVDWDDLLDVLEANGGYCDCEVALNLPEDVDLALPVATSQRGDSNPWLLPPNFAYSESARFNKVIVSRAGVGKNTRTSDGELLVPAPWGARPTGRIRKSVHFFVGCQSGKASEVGVVQACDPLSAADFARRVTAGGIEGISQFAESEAAFVLARIASLGEGMTVGVNFTERVGVASKHTELTIHRVILRR
jgi:uncharacterized protein DUF2695